MKPIHCDGSQAQRGKWALFRAPSKVVMPQALSCDRRQRNTVLLYSKHIFSKRKLILVGAFMQVDALILMRPARPDSHSPCSALVAEVF